MLQSQIAKRAKLSKWFLFNTLGKLPTHNSPLKVQVPGACLSFWPHLQPLVLLSPTLQSSRTPGLLYASITLLVCSLSTKAGSHFLSLPHYRLASWTPTLPLRWSIQTCFCPHLANLIIPLPLVMDLQIVFCFPSCNFGIKVVLATYSCTQNVIPHTNHTPMGTFKPPHLFGYCFFMPFNLCWSPQLNFKIQQRNGIF